VFCRQAIPVSVYDCFIIDHGFGLCGPQRGRLWPPSQFRDPGTAAPERPLALAAAPGPATAHG
jgi:hypothetical protein